MDNEKTDSYYIEWSGKIHGKDGLKDKEHYDKKTAASSGGVK